MAHPWIVTGPWYRWDTPGDPAAGRQSRPELQKYASTSFVNDFLAEPQRSLKYKDEDRVQRIAVHPSPGPDVLSNLIARLTLTRKIFLSNHARFYLVVVEFHCDMPGLPAAQPGEVYDAGFVARRSRTIVPDAVVSVATAALTKIKLAEARLQDTEKTASGRPRSAVAVLLDRALRGPIQKRRAELLQDYIAGRVEAEELAATQAIQLTKQGWFPGPFEGTGEWRDLPEEEPQDLAGEAVFPLYPLIPDPGNPRHSGTRRGIWFGVLPTGGSDVEVSGAARFDDRHLYEVRCFARQRKPDDCPGERVWSLPSQGYKLASHFDLDGTSHRPVTIQMPDLAALQAQMGSRPMGTGTGVRVVTPPGSDLQFGGKLPDLANKGIGGGSICFFSIPLITIVAMFVLRLFLPIVVFLFGLWFLLRLKFCVLPTFELSADLAADIKADPGGVQAEIDGAIKANFGHEDGQKLIDSIPSVTARAQLVLDLAADFSESLSDEERAGIEPRAPGRAGPAEVGLPLPDPAAQLEYYDVLEVPA